MRTISVMAASALAAFISTSALHAQTFAFQTLDNPGDPTFNQLLGIRARSDQAATYPAAVR